MDTMIDRRSFLATGATASIITIAGCAQDGDSDENEDGDGGSDGSDTSDDGDGGSSDTDDGGGSDGSDSSDGGDGASFDLDLTVDQLPDAFESLVIEFTGFDTFSMTGQTQTFESDPVEVDLAELAASGGSTDLMETTLPAGEYDNFDYFIEVIDTTLSSGEGEQTFRTDENPEVHDSLNEPDAFVVEAGESITLTAQLSVEDAYDYDWKFIANSSVDRES